MIYIELFLGFLKVGLFAFGGAYAAIPLIREVVMGYGWLSEEAFMYMIAVSESTPGPIMVNLATYVGRVQGGFAGAVIATAAVVLPSFIIILLIMVLLRSFIKNKYFKAVLKGLKPCMVGLVLATGVYMIIENLGISSAGTDWKSLGLTALLALLMFGSGKMFGKKMSPVLLIVISAAAGIIIF